MKDLNTFFGLLLLAAVAAICKMIGIIFGEGVYTGTFFIALAVGIISLLYWQLSKTKD
jgi:hypothetical protein